MAYIGKLPPTGFSATSKQSFSGDASTVAFTLTKAVALATDLEVFVDNVQQEPTTAYTVSSTTLTFTAAPATGTNNIYVVHRNGHADNGLLPPQDLGTTDYIFGDDLTLKSDAAVLGFGADTDTTLTHVADTGLLLNSTRQLQFGDSGTYIHQSADGVLDLVSDTELELNATEVEVNATTIDINGALAADGGAVFNEDSADVDFRVESNSNTHALFVDGGNDCVVIGGPDQVNGGTLSISTSAEGASLSLLTRSTTDSHQCEIILQKSSTDSGNFAATVDGEALGRILFRGVNTSTVSDIGAEISVVQVGAESGTVPADMIFKTNETERFRIRTSGGIAIGGTGDANTVSDYEEGTWTPRLGASTAGVATPGSNNNGYYTKIGRVVHVTGFLVWSEITTSMSGTLQLQGLPFTVANLTGNSPSQPITRMFNGFTNGSSIPHAFQAAPNTTVADVIGFSGQGGSGQNWTTSITASSSGNIYDINLTYITSD